MPACTDPDGMFRSKTPEHSGEDYEALIAGFVCPSSQPGGWPVAALAQGQTPNNQNGKNHSWGTNRNTAQNSTTSNRGQQGWGPHRTTTNPSNPSGWAQGQKVGWHGNAVPPGQATRDPYEHRHHRHHRDFDHDHFRHDRDHDHDRH